MNTLSQTLNSRLSLPFWNPGFNLLLGVKEILDGAPPPRKKLILGEVARGVRLSQSFYFTRQWPTLIQWEICQRSTEATWVKTSWYKLITRHRSTADNTERRQRGPASPIKHWFQTRATSKTWNHFYFWDICASASCTYFRSSKYNTSIYYSWVISNLPGWHVLQAKMSFQVKNSGFWKAR